MGVCPGPGEYPNVQTASAVLSGYAAIRLFRPSCPVDSKNHFLQEGWRVSEEHGRRASAAEADIHVRPRKAIEGCKAKSCVFYQYRPIHLLVGLSFGLPAARLALAPRELVLTRIAAF